MPASIFLGFSLYRLVHGLAAEQAMLAQAARYQEQVMGIVGHDIRSPLAAIMATAELSAQTATSRQEGKRNERILRSARRIDALAAALVEFTRLQVYDRIPLPNDKFVIDHACSGDGRAHLDCDRFGQAVEILLEQSATYPTLGSIVQVVSRDDGPAVIVEVAASGHASAGTLLTRMFEPLAPPGDEQPVVLSRGFSLCLARELVTAHHGTLDVRSDDTRGLVFRIHIPRAPQAAIAQPAA